MSHQSPLFYESIHDALRELVRVLGGAKTVGLLLWPGKSMQDAATRLHNCLDHNRPEKLSPEDLLVLLQKGREFDCHVVMRYLNERSGYTAPVPVDPADESAELQRRYIATVAEQKQIAERMERLASSPIIRAVPKAAA